jgi:O-antigen ligase
MPSGFPLYTTLYRYLTSKGLRKDAEGIKALTDTDIQNIENGVTNVIFQQKKYSLYPRIYQTVWEYYMYSVTGDPSYQSFSQRIEFTKAAVAIIKDNPWFGVGAGNWKEEFKNTYIKNKSKLKEGLYASSHNQYLNYMVKFGITGFIIIMFLIIFPVVKTRAYNDLLFLIFLVFLFFANFADSNFESHMGSSFFIFFYCLFIIQPNSSYLNLSEK